MDYTFDFGIVGGSYFWNGYHWGSSFFSEWKHMRKILWIIKQDFLNVSLGDHGFDFALVGGSHFCVAIYLKVVVSKYQYDKNQSDPLDPHMYRWIHLPLSDMLYVVLYFEE